MDAALPEDFAEPVDTPEDAEEAETTDPDDLCGLRPSNGSALGVGGKLCAFAGV